MHATPQVPAEHRATSFALYGQTCPHDPQFIASLAKSTQRVPQLGAGQVTSVGGGTSVPGGTSFVDCTSSLTATSEPSGRMTSNETSIRGASIDPSKRAS